MSQEINFKSLEDFLIQTIGDEYASLETVLEFGCGHKGFAGFYKTEGRRSLGVDLHESFRASWEALGVDYLVSDGITIPLPDKHVDLVVSHSVVEHVEDLPQSLAEINRILKPGKIGYITVSPLYFSPNGSHIRTLPDWEHLNPDSKYYMMSQPIDRVGAYLNKLTVSELLAMVGNLPWNIIRLDRKIISNSIPDWVENVPRLDLLTKEFRLVFRKLHF